MVLLKESLRKSLFLFFALLLVPVSVMAEQELSTTMYLTQEPPKTITMDYNTFKTLERNSNEALNIIKASQLTLTEAQNLTIEQGKLLAELREINQKQAEELTKAKEISMKQLDSLKRTEESLNRSIESYKELQHKYNVKKRQNKTIAVVSVIAVGGAFYLANK